MSPPLNEEQLKKLNKIYYDEKNFFGRDRLFQLANSGNDNVSISRRQIDSWLKKQEIHQMFLRPKAPKMIQRTVLKHPNSQIGLDLIDMSRNEYEGYKWIFTAIDLFSKKAYAIPMKNKDNKTVAKAFEKIIEKIDAPISSVRSDNGSEFVSKTFQSLLESHNIKQVLSLPAKPQSNGNIERFNQTLKRLLKQATLVKKSYDWVSLIDTCVDNYNNTVQSTTKAIPNNVEEEDDYETIQENIHNAVSDRNDSNKTVYATFTKVRIVEKDIDKGTNWSKKIYTIEKSYKPRGTVSSVYYKLKGLKQKFYNHDLQPILAVQNQIDIPEVFVISKIVEPSVQGGVGGYLIMWKGYKGETTFQTRENLMEDVPKMIQKYESQNNIKWYKLKNGNDKFIRAKPKVEKKTN